MFIFIFIIIALTIAIAITAVILKAKDAYPGPFNDAIQSSNPFSTDTSTNSSNNTPFPNAPTGLQGAFQDLANAVNAAVANQDTASEATPPMPEVKDPKPEAPKEDDEETNRFDLIDMEE
jgi:hypothetical protein